MIKMLVLLKGLKLLINGSKVFLAKTVRRTVNREKLLIF